MQIVTAVFIMALDLYTGLGSQDEIHLIEFLFQRQGYNPLVRPVSNMSDTVRVQFGMALIQLIDVVGVAYIVLCQTKSGIC